MNSAESQPSAKQPSKQFIAGAVCSVCKKIDGVRFWRNSNQYFKDCVYCGHSEQLIEETPEAQDTLSITIKQID